MSIDLSSDTVTQPTQEMRTAMCEAEGGDEQKGEDPTVKSVERMMLHGIRFFAPGTRPTVVRAITHLHIADADIEQTIAAVAQELTPSRHLME